MILLVLRRRGVTPQLVPPVSLVLLAHQQTDLGRHEGLRAALPERPSEQQFVGEGAVHVGRVEQARTGVQRRVHRTERAVAALLRAGVGPVHRHAAESDRAHFERRRTDCPALQLPYPSLCRPQANLIGPARFA